MIKLTKTIDNGTMCRSRMTGISLFDSGFWGILIILREPRGKIIIQHREKGGLNNVNMMLAERRSWRNCV